ncbi:MAG TPA: peptidase M23 [Pseudomonadota bacterium]|nr:peptidase M23 [Pseudomonadota bacterium]
MRTPTKLLLLATALCALAALPTLARAATANGPICDTAAKVNSTTYYGCGGSSHTALDIANGTCSVWNHRAMLVGSYRYTLFGGCPNSCGACSAGAGCCNGGAGNYYVVSGSNGWDFRQLHSNANADTATKTCDRCPLGLVGSTGNSTGAHSHSDNRQYGTRKSAWYTSVGTTCGSSGNCSGRVGVPTL